MTELANGSKIADTGVKIATLTALFEVLRKSKASISEASINVLLNLINSHDGEEDGILLFVTLRCHILTFSDIILAVNAKLLSALLRVLPNSYTENIIRFVGKPFFDYLLRYYCLIYSETAYWSDQSQKHQF